MSHATEGVVWNSYFDLVPSRALAIVKHCRVDSMCTKHCTVVERGDLSVARVGSAHCSMAVNILLPFPRSESLQRHCSEDVVHQRHCSRLHRESPPRGVLGIKDARLLCRLPKSCPRLQMRIIFGFLYWNKLIWFLALKTKTSKKPFFYKLNLFCIYSLL